MGANENKDINEIISKTKESVRNGVAGKTMSITDISLAMTKAMDEIKEALIREIENVVEDEIATDAKDCPECGKPLKKTRN